jgi:hypothetical protein
VLVSTSAFAGSLFGFGFSYRSGHRPYYYRPYYRGYYYRYCPPPVVYRRPPPVAQISWIRSDFRLFSRFA